MSASHCDKHDSSNPDGVVVHQSLPNNSNTYVTQSENIQLNLFKDINFSITHFHKENKGLVNPHIHCFMNVTLQSLIACPAFLNMLTAI